MAEKIALWSAVANVIMAVGTIVAVMVAVRAMRVTHNQFEISNIPYLQIDNSKITFIEITRTINIQLAVANLGQHPAEILSRKLGYCLGGLNDCSELSVLVEREETSVPVSMYVMKENPRPMDVDIQVSDPQLFQEIVYGSKHIYLSGELIYTNLVNHKKRKYEFSIRLTASPIKTQRDILLNKNIDLK